MVEKTKVFVIMPFEDKFFEVYEMLKIQFQEGFEFSNAGDEGNQQNIMQDIIRPIYEADIIVADLTGLNPNVMYELGIAHSFNKKTIIITQDDLSNLPFDLKQYRAKDYSTHFKSFQDLVEYLKTNFEGGISGSVAFGNPVKDFLSLSRIEYHNWFEEQERIILEDNSDKGFLDYLTEIEEDGIKLAADIQSMTDDMTEMSNGIAKSTTEIDRVKKNGGSGTVSFVRKEARKAGKYIDIFSVRLRKHNDNISALWDKIENNTLGLLENPFATHEENRESLIKYLSSLQRMKASILTSDESVKGLQISMEKNMMLERSLSQALRFAINDLSNYLSISGRIAASIDTILSKSKFVVGEFAPSLDS